MVPRNLILRCYGFRTSRKTWVAKCIDFDLVVEEDSLEARKKALIEAMNSYLEAVYQTDDKESIPRLLKRRAPLIDFCHYYWIKFRCQLRCPSERLSFEKSIPFVLAAA